MEKTPPRHPHKRVKEKEDKKDKDRGKKKNVRWNGSL
jgi:hypothetical protein